MKSSLVLELQQAALNSEEPVSQLLRMAYAVAMKLDSTDILSWIKRELNGYRGCTHDEIPDYRLVSGEPKAQNPYHGWQPIMIDDAEIADALLRRKVNSTVGEMEDLLKSRDSSGPLAMLYPPKQAAILRKSIGWDFPVHLEFSYSEIARILDVIRNRVLDWALQLEKSGVLGEGMTFTAEEKETAHVVNIEHVQNLSTGVIGNVGAAAEIAPIQTISNVNFDADAIRTLLDDIEDSVKDQPSYEEVSKEISDIRNELSRTPPDESAVVRGLRSIASIVKGAVSGVLTNRIEDLLNLIQG